MENIRLSVIIPVYNIEAYIEKNICSLIRFNIKEAEFLYVNDGSTDKTREILGRYEKLDTRIKIIDKKNSGLGAARNSGMDACNGQYVYFVDGDDTLDPEALEKSLAIAEANSLDILKGEYRIVDDHGKILRDAVIRNDIDKKRVWTGEEWLLGPRKYDIVCADLFRRDYLIRNSLRFAEGVIHEDSDFVIKVIYYAEKIMYCGIVLYNYVMRKNSIMHSRNANHYKDAYKAAKRNETFMLEKVQRNVADEAFTPYIIEQYYSVAHLAIQNGIRLRDCMENKVIREDILKWLNKSKTKKIWIQYICLKYKWYEIYDFIYRIYNYLRVKL